MSNSGESLFKMYDKAGRNVLAHRVQHLFHPIKTPEDIALHNDILAEVLKIIDGKERSLLQGMIDDILYKPVKREKRFLVRMAQLILDIGFTKGKKK